MKHLILFLLVTLSVEAFTSADGEADDCNDKTEKPFIGNVLKSLDMPCGLKGSVEERIKDCSGAEGAKKGNFVLVAKTADGNEVYKDTKSGLIWSEGLSKTMNHYDALKACKPSLPEMAGIGGSWRLPTEEEYKTANSNGISSSIASMKNHWWWSSSVRRINSGVALLFYGNDVIVGDNFRSVSDSVRCVLK